MLSGKFVLPIDPIPKEVVIRPSLKKDQQSFTVLFALDIVYKWLLILCHILNQNLMIINIKSLVLQIKDIQFLW